MPTVPFLARSGSHLTNTELFTWQAAYLVGTVRPGQACQSLSSVFFPNLYIFPTTGDLEITEDITIMAEDLFVGSEVAIGTYEYSADSPPQFTASIEGFLDNKYFFGTSLGIGSSRESDTPVIAYSFSVGAEFTTLTGSYDTERVFLPDGTTVFLDPFPILEMQWVGSGVQAVELVESDLGSTSHSCIVDGSPQTIFIHSIHRTFSIEIPRSAVDIQFRYRDTYDQAWPWSEPIRLYPYLDAAVTLEEDGVIRVDPQNSLAVGSLGQNYSIRYSPEAPPITVPLGETMELDVSDDFSSDLNLAFDLRLQSDFGCLTSQFQSLPFHFVNGSMATTRNGQVIVPTKKYSQKKTDIRLIINASTTHYYTALPPRSTLDATKVHLMRFESTFYAGCFMGGEYVLLKSEDECFTWEFMSTFPEGYRVISWCILDVGGFAAIALGDTDLTNRYLYGSVSWDGIAWSTPTLQKNSTAGAVPKGTVKQAHSSGESHLVVSDGETYQILVRDFFASPNPDPNI